MITDESLRDQLAGVDPAAGEVAPDVLNRVAAGHTPAQRPRWRRPSVLLAAAAVAAVGLIGLSVLPKIGLEGDDDRLGTGAKRRHVRGRASPGRTRGED